MRPMSILLLVLLGVLLRPAVAEESAESVGLLGSWRWTQESNDCTEIYSFGRGGVASTISGSELTRQLYVLLGRSGDGRRLRVALVTLEDNGLRDCAEVAADDSGLAYEIWVEFSPDGNRLLVCFAEAGPECIGPLRRDQGI